MATPIRPGSLSGPQTGISPIYASQFVREIKNGQVNCLAEFTLTAGATQTTVVDYNVGADSVILLTPSTANAAAAITTTYIASQGKYEFIVGHANNAQADRTFRYAAFG